MNRVINDTMACTTPFQQAMALVFSEMFAQLNLKHLEPWEGTFKFISDQNTPYSTWVGTSCMCMGDSREYDIHNVTRIYRQLK